MNNSDDSWSRCAKEFPRSAVDNKKIEFARELDASINRPVHVKRLEFNNGLSSCGRGLVATDIALANIEQIERNELVSKWIADGMCTPPISEQNTSYPCSPVFENSPPEVEVLDEKEFPIVLKDLEKSPLIKCPSRRKTKSRRLKSLEKSPQIRKSLGISKDKEEKFGFWDKRKLDDTQNSFTISEWNTSSPIFGNSLPEVEIIEEKEFPAVLRDLEKSPIIKCRSRKKTESQRLGRSAQGLEKSPQIRKKWEVSEDKEEKFGPWDKRKLDDTQSSCPSDKSPIFGKRGDSKKKNRPRVKRRRLEERRDFHAQTSLSSLGKENSTLESILRFPETEESKLVGVVTKVERETSMVSQEIFDDEIITASPNCRRILPCEIKSEEDLFCSYEQTNEPLKREDDKKEVELIVPEPLWAIEECCQTPVIESGIKVERSSLDRVKVEENSFESVIQDTEEFLLPKAQEISNCRDNNRSEFLILDTEFSVEKRNFVTDTERIDCDTSSETEEENPAVNQEKIITRVESDSDKTVSDIIEEPTTQDFIEPVKPRTDIASQYTLVSCCSRKSLIAASPKISETMSLEDLISPQISVANISVETTPPRTPEFFAPAPNVLDSGKKKKSRPKKGSLCARLQKLISGQVSAVRLWRHQMSRESVVERSSSPCATLLVIDTWIEYGKNMHYSEVVNDPCDLLNDCFNESAHSKDTEKKLSKNLVVMTNPDFVGSVKLLRETVFNIYPPWQIFNRNSSGEKLILNALYFRVVSHPLKVKLEPLNVDESEAGKHSSEIIETEVTRQYECPCLLNGKIDDSCLTKFTSHKIDIIDEIIK